MPRYFFHEYVRGERNADPQGQQMPANLKKAELDAHDTYLATEVSNGNKTLFVVRGKVVVEEW